MTLLSVDAFSRGDVLDFTQILLDPADGTYYTEHRTAVVVWVDHVREIIIYEGHQFDERLPSGSGYFTPDQIGAKPYGLLVGVDIIGKTTYTKVKYL
jgi:hypothetical protein